jgi:hypothetical protein
MAGEYKPITDRELAVGVVERGLNNKPVPGTKGHLQKLRPNELEYLRWLGEKQLRSHITA